MQFHDVWRFYTRRFKRANTHKDMSAKPSQSTKKLGVRDSTAKKAHDQVIINMSGHLFFSQVQIKSLRVDDTQKNSGKKSSHKMTLSVFICHFLCSTKWPCPTATVS